MPSPEEIVTFLEEKDAIQEGESPWPSWDGKEKRELVHWGEIFPSRGPPRRRGSLDDVVPEIVDEGDTGWRAPLSPEVEERVRAAAGKKPSEPPFPDEQNSNLPQRERMLSVWDRCAWYQPMHFFGNDWGIYIRRTCIYRRMEETARFLPIGTPVTPALLTALYRGAFASFFLHEQFHHKVESLGIRMHVVQRRSAYQNYKAKVYRLTWGTDDNLEEALATADAYHRLAESPYAPWLGRAVLNAVWDYMEWSVPGNPPGYRKAASYFDWYDYDRAEDLLQAQFDEAVLKPTRNPRDWYFATRMLQSMFKVTDHLWEIV